MADDRKVGPRLYVGNVTNGAIRKSTWTDPKGVEHKIAAFRMVVDRYEKNDEGKRVKTGSDFFDVTGWDARAEAIEKNVRGGMRMLVRGPRVDSDYTAADGSTKTNHAITAWELGPDISQGRVEVRAVDPLGLDPGGQSL